MLVELFARALQNRFLTVLVTQLGFSVLLLETVAVAAVGGLGGWHQLNLNI